MPGPLKRHDESTAATASRSIRWDALAAVIASLVGLLALLVAGYTAHIQRQQVRAEVWPYLMWASSDTQSEYMWLNKGVGPAVVKSARVLVGGKVQPNWKAVMQSLGLGPMEYGQSTFNGSVLSPGETLEWLKFNDHDDFQRFRGAAGQVGLAFEVCYCSTLGDCWANDGKGTSRAAVDNCPVVPEDEQFDD